jgi:GntR family negative regulator for fad regulon and positive regulator of fabA
MHNNAPQRPLEYAEETLVSRILDGTFPVGSTLPGERDLATQIGVTRPTLREALRRLERDGWLTIQQGKATQVNDYWREGGLNVIATLVRHSPQLPENFIPNLLQIRQDMAPSYIATAVDRAPTEVTQLLANGLSLPDTPLAFAHYDWQMHHTLTVLSGNPIYTLILNGFVGFYEQMALFYFNDSQARASSRQFYRDMLTCAQTGDATTAYAIGQSMMETSIRLWEEQTQPLISLQR